MKTTKSASSSSCRRLSHQAIPRARSLRASRTVSARRVTSVRSPRTRTPCVARAESRGWHSAGAPPQSDPGDGTRHDRAGETPVQASLRSCARKRVSCPRNSTISRNEAFYQHKSDELRSFRCSLRSSRPRERETLGSTPREWLTPGTRGAVSWPREREHGRHFVNSGGGTRLAGRRPASKLVPGSLVNPFYHRIYRWSVTSPRTVRRTDHRRSRAARRRATVGWRSPHSPKTTMCHGALINAAAAFLFPAGSQRGAAARMRCVKACGSRRRGGAVIWDVWLASEAYDSAVASHKPPPRARSRS